MLKTQPQKMSKQNIEPEEDITIEGTITRLSQLSREQFHDLMSSNHPEARKYRRYANKEFAYRKKSYVALNDFYRDQCLKD